MQLFVHGHLDDQAARFQHYIAQLRRNGTWGDHLTLEAASHLYAKSFTIVNAITGAVTTIGNSGNLDLPTLHLLHYPEHHYDALDSRPADDVRPQVAGHELAATAKDEEPLPGPLHKHHHLRDHPPLRKHTDAEAEELRDSGGGGRAEHVVVMSVNIESLRRHVDGLLAHSFDIAMVTEHKVAQREQHSWTTWFLEQGYVAEWATTPHSSANIGSGGVLLLAKAPLRLIKVQHELAAPWEQKGRLLLVDVVLPRGTLFARVAAVYQYTEPSRRLSDYEALWRSIAQIAAEWTPSPLLKLIAGDLQANCMEQPAFTQAVASLPLVDVVATFEPDRLPTHRDGGILDHLFATHMLAATARLAWTGDLEFPTHAPIFGQFATREQPSDLGYANVPRALPISAQQQVRWSAITEPWSYLATEFKNAVADGRIDTAELLWSQRWEAFLLRQLDIDETKYTSQMQGRDRDYCTKSPPHRPCSKAFAAYTLTHRQVAASVGKLRGGLSRPPATTWAQTCSYGKQDSHLARRLETLHSLTVNDDEATWDAALQSLQRSLDKMRKEHTEAKRQHWRTNLLTPSEAVRMVNYQAQTPLLAVSNDECTASHVDDMDALIIDENQKIAAHPSLESVCQAAMKGAKQAPECKLQPVTPQGLMDSLKQMKQRASPGPVGWHTREMKSLPVAAWHDFSSLVNQAEAVGVTPRRWQAVFNTYLQKKQNSHHFKDLRPISVSSSLWRLYARRRFADILPQVEAALHDSQVGGRPQLSTASSILRIRLTLDKEPKSVAFQLDLQKFFQTVPTGVCLQLCRQAGVDGALLELLHGHYDALRQYNRLPARHLGRPWQCQRGLPQGDPLSVALANMYLSSVLRQIKTCAHTLVST